MYRLAMRAMPFSDCLCHCRMRVDGADELFNPRFDPQSDSGFCNQFGRPRSDHVDAEHLVVLLIGHDLHEPVSADTASSTIGTSGGSSSKTVTSLPKRRKIDANSTPRRSHPPRSRASLSHSGQS